MHPNAAQEGIDPEPTLRDVLSAVSTCNATLHTLNLHMGGLKENMAQVFVRSMTG